MTASRITATVGGKKHGIHAEILNPRATGGTPVVLIHGFGGSLGVWDPVLEPLGPDRPILRLDLLGHGQSDMPTTAYDVGDQADIVFAVLANFHLGECHVLAHSAGGDTAVAMLEKDAARIRSVTLLGTAPSLTFVHMATTAKLIRLPVLGPALWRITSDGMVRRGLRQTFAPEFSTVPEIYVRSLRRMTHAAYVEGIDALERFKNERDLVRRVEVLSPKPRVIFGTRDQWVHPAAAEAWAEGAGITTTMIEGVGHTPMVEAPARTVEIFLRHVAEVESAAGKAPG